MARSVRGASVLRASRWHRGAAVGENAFEQIVDQSVVDGSMTLTARTNPALRGLDFAGLMASSASSA